MPSVNGIKCSLVVVSDDHHPAAEYGCTTEANFACTYVIASAHQRFYISVATTEFVHEILEIYVYIDGKYQNSSIWMELDTGKMVDEKYHGKRERDDLEVAFERPWRFDALVEADEENGDGPEASDVGTIEVVVLRCNEVPKQGKGRGHRYPRVAGSSSRELSNPTIEPHPHSKHYWKNWAAEEQHDANPPGAGPVCKKDIKKQNLSHRVTTGREEVVESLVSDAHLMFLDSFEKPYCILVMKYRSRVLVSLGYIPMSPVPSGASSRASSPGVDLEELRALSKEDMLKELVRYKKMAGRSSAKRIKPENPAGGSEKQSKRSKVKEAFLHAGGKVVDLTDD